MRTMAGESYAVYGKKDRIGASYNGLTAYWMFTAERKIRRSSREGSEEFYAT